MRSSFLRTVFKTVKSYSRREKVLSCVFLLVIIVSLVRFFSGFFVADYREAVVGKIANLNPLMVDFNEVDRDISGLVFSGLMRYDPEKSAIVPDMADMEIDEEKLIYTFQLRQGLTWHDGKPVTIDDVYFTFADVVQRPDFFNPVLKANFDGVEISKADENKIVFKLKRPNAFFVTNLTVGILPKHILGQVQVKELRDNDFNRSPVGTGPFRVKGGLTTHVDGRTEATLVRFSRYYADLPGIRGVNIVAYPTVESLLKDRDEFDGIVKLSEGDVEKLREDPRFMLIPYELPQYTALFLNMNSQILKDRGVRIALQKSLDKSQLLQEFKGIEPVDTPFMELKQEEWIYKLNVTEAMGALFDAGWRFDKEKTEKFRKSKEGEVLRLRLLLPQFAEGSRKAQEFEMLSDFLVKAWEAIGIEVETEWLDAASFNEKLRNRDYDVVIAGQSLGYNFDTFAYWHSSQASGNGLNLSQYRGFAADSLIEAIRTTFDKGKKDELLKKLAKQISEDVPAIFLYRPRYYYASNGRVSNLQFRNLTFTTDRFANISDWKRN